MQENSVIQNLLLSDQALELADQDDHWHVVTCGVVVGNGTC